eukprot:SAG22_NODE_3711_length_1562_cov_31.228298_1_plen_62_part_10
MKGPPARPAARGSAAPGALQSVRGRETETRTFEQVTAARSELVHHGHRRRARGGRAAAAARA